MSRLPYLIVIVTLLSFGSGCCCLSKCGLFGGGPGCSPTIPPPPTYSMQMPGAATPQYYSGNPSLSGTPTGMTGAQSMNIADQNAGAINSQQPIYPSANYQVPNVQGSSSTVYGIGNGSSRVVANDYNSTPYNDRLDPNRLGVSDASAVRAPTNYQSFYGQAPMNDPRYAQAGNPGNYGYSAPARGTTFQGQSVVQGQFSPRFAGQMPGNNPNANQVSVSQRQHNPQQDPNRQAGWRDRQTADNGLNLNR